MGDALEKIAYRVEEAHTLVGLGRTKFIELLSLGEIDSFKCGKARLIPRESLEAWVERKKREEAEPHANE
jgi:excisionase family DNA binding protein